MSKMVNITIRLIFLFCVCGGKNFFCPDSPKIAPKSEKNYSAAQHRSASTLKIGTITQIIQSASKGQPESQEIFIAKNYRSH